MASGNGKQLPESPTELQRGADSFMSMAESLAGGQPEPEKKPDAKAEVKPATKPTQPDPKEAEAQAAKVEDEEPASLAILGDDDAAKADDDDEDGAEGGKTDDASKEAKLFKQREKRRAAEAANATLTAELAAVKKERDELAAGKTTTTSAPVLDGYFAKVKSEADLAALEQQWANYREFLEDREDGYADEATGREYTREEVRAEMRVLGKEQAKIPAVRKVFTDRAAQQEAATVKANTLYPFVLNAGKAHNDVALSLAQEFPELNSSPHRALLLGMLTTARLVEQKKFTITPALKSKAPEPAAAAAPAAPVKAPPSAPPPARAHHTPVPDTSSHEHARMIAGDMDAATDWALGLVGDY